MEKDVILTIINLASSAFFAILFIQSGWDKISHRKDNGAWLREHFSKTPFKSSVPFLLTSLTILELLTGMLSAIGFFTILVWDQTLFSFLGFTGAAVTLLSLFLGQRMAKDYAGAASIAGYFIVVLIALICITI